MAAPSGARKLRGCLSRWPVAAWAIGLVGATLLARAEEAEGPSGAKPPPTYTCQQLANSRWPTNAAGLLALRDEMEANVTRCAESAAYLALLGGLWLDSGEPRQALLWLERALLLDPQALGARADYALALAALGEGTARDALVAEWRTRADVPPALLRRLLGAPPVNGDRQRGQPQWIRRGEAAVRVGKESNLDRSPVLDSITLTYQQGPVEQPFAIPLRPRKGEMAQADLGWQVARDSGSNSLWQGSLAASARHAPSESSTDWYYLQGRLEHWRAVGNWRAQLHGSLALSGGPLSEPYTATRLGLAAERDLFRCTYRTAAEGEFRRYQSSKYLNGNIIGVAFSAQCPLDARETWRLAVEARRSADLPDQSGRPGGRQDQTGIAVRVTGSLGPIQIDGYLSHALARDTEGFSPLLENNAIREFRQSQVQLELAYTMTRLIDNRTQALVQFGAQRQKSNLLLFSNEGRTVTLGIRRRW